MDVKHYAKQNESDTKEPMLYEARDKRWKGSYKGLEGGKNGELLFNRYRVSVCEDGGSGEEGGERYTMNILKV